MSNKYNAFIDVLKTLKSGETKRFTPEKIEKLIENKLPKSFYNKSYLKSENSPVGRFCNETDIKIEVIKPEFYFTKNNEKERK